MSSKTCIVAFDLYGTLLDTASVSRKLSEHLPLSINSDAVSTEWRKYQLEYTWRLTSMGSYESFDTVTLKSLKHAVSEAGCHLSDDAIQDVIKSYDQLSVFDDVPESLKKLNQMPNILSLIFSNGTEEMVGKSIENCPDLWHFTKLVLPFVVVNEVKNYKPSREVYNHLARRVGKEHALHEVWLISGNPFDVVGARRAGLNAIWIDRKGRGWTDQLGEPTGIANSLLDAIDIISRSAG